LIGIQDIVTWVPESCIDNVAQAESFGMDADFATDRIGARTLSVMPEGMDTSDMVVKAVGELLSKAEVEAADIQILVVCTQNPDGRGLPHTSAIAQSKLGLPTSIAAFDISLGCSGYVYGLTAVKGFMQSAGLQRGILVTADPYSKIIDRQDKSTSLLFGDAATATLLSAEPRLSIGASRFSTDGAGGEAIINRDGSLEMAGRQVFNFAASSVPPQIISLLEDEGLTLDDIDLFALHQGSRYIVQTLIKRMGLPEGRTPVMLEDTGNTVSSSIPLILESVLDRSDVNRVLISGFGVGLSWASSILHRTA
jgi:3-oxoacyl-[acyl-carrier-protein] synthase-3